MTATTRQPLALFQAERGRFLEARGADPDAVAVVFALDRNALDVVTAMETAALRPLGLTHAGFVLLMTLWVSGPQETRQLARVLRVSRPSIVSAVDTLERNGHVTRASSEEDRRLVLVSLTPEGRRLVERAQTAWHRCERKVAGVLTPSEQRTFARLAHRLGDVVRHGALEDGV